jgi:hypothetical protein
MLVVELKDYIKKHPRVSMLDITKTFRLEAEQIRVFLDSWIARGKLEKFTPQQVCGDGKCGCTSCIVLAMELYTWKEYS